MNNCSSSSNWRSYLWGPTVQTWQPSRYHSPVEYTCDPLIPKVTQLWNAREGGIARKADYPVVPYNASFSHYLPVIGRFDITQCGQTDVLDLITVQRPVPYQSQAISLANTISSLVYKMGMIVDNTTGKNLGTCTLIANNLVLVARHVVEGHDIRNDNVKFGYMKLQGSLYNAGQTSFTYVVEEDALHDYAIIQLKEPLGGDLGFVDLNIENHTSMESALLHYPLGKPLKVSVHTFVHTQHQTDCLLAYHDSDYFSSGGAYFDPAGCMIAMHLGTELEGGTLNLLRYALPLEAIVRKNPHSLLGKLACGTLSHKANTGLTYLAPANHNYLIDEEGRESEKILRNFLTHELKKDQTIKRNKNGTISFSKTNLEYIANRYKKKYNSFEESCLGITGLHEFTRLFSVTGMIESDHTIPHHVWKLTTNPKMKRVVAGGGGQRQGENKMPAITIPWEIHRRLLTTGGVPGYQAFHQSLIDLCNQGKVDCALIKCYREYKVKGLNLQAYKNEIKRSLDDHVALGLISQAQKTKILAAVF